MSFQVAYAGFVARPGMFLGGWQAEGSLGAMPWALMSWAAPGWCGVLLTVVSVR